VGYPASIELQCGPSRTFSRLVWIVWLLAAGSLIYSVPHYRWPWLMGAAVALFHFHPASGSALRRQHAVRIQADGCARIDDAAFRWRPVWRANRLGILLEISGAGRTRQVLACASLNRADDYRHLLIWCRYPRSGTPAGASVSE